MAGQNPPLGANNSSMYAPGVTNGAIMPSAGHYSDMQTLMQNMEALSGWLQQNREDFARVQEGLHVVERGQVRLEHLPPLKIFRIDMPSSTEDRLSTGARSFREVVSNIFARQGRLAGQSLGSANVITNGDATNQDPSSASDPNVLTLSSLSAALSATQSRNLALEAQNTDLLKLQQLYEDTLTDATERIRNFVFAQNEHVLGLHSHYASLLQQSRAETLEVRLGHQEWQASLSRLSENLKMAMLANETEQQPLRKRCAALKEENRMLREMVGWEPVQPDSDEEEQKAGKGDVGGGGGARGREHQVTASLELRQQVQGTASES